jgi:beta-phosphoglucomutase-like phosphatase (HAD superfamily)
MLPMPWRPRAVVFDFDGVLADTEDLHLLAFRDVLGRRGWPLDRETYLERYLSLDDRGLIRAYAADRGLTLDEPLVTTLLGEKMSAFLSRVSSGDVFFAGARACVDRLGAHFPLAIATGARRAEVVHMLDAAGLFDRFAAIVSADDVRSSKPSPEPYLAAARLLGARGDECAAIEDSPGGLLSALRAGLRTIGIATSLPAEALSAAHLVVTHLDEITVERIAALDVVGTRVVG